MHASLLVKSSKSSCCSVIASGGGACSYGAIPWITSPASAASGLAVCSSVLLPYGLSIVNVVSLVAALPSDASGSISFTSGDYFSGGDFSLPISFPNASSNFLQLYQFGPVLDSVMPFHVVRWSCFFMLARH